MDKNYDAITFMTVTLGSSEELHCSPKSFLRLCQISMMDFFFAKIVKS